MAAPLIIYAMESVQLLLADLVITEYLVLRRPIVNALIALLIIGAMDSQCVQYVVLHNILLEVVLTIIKHVMIVQMENNQMQVEPLVSIV
tara:strand:- start:240 stop:509 length:270 start_codon:yes stop_codon:yes gene_type:complete